MQTEVKAIRTGGSNEEVELKASRDGDLRIAQFLPPYAMLCAAGKIFCADISGAAAKIPVEATPQLEPEWLLYNSNTSGGKHLVLLHVGIGTTTGTTGLGLSLLACVAIGEQTIASASYSNADISCLDGTPKVPGAFLVNNPTILAPQPSWVLLAANNQIAADYLANGIVAWVDGKMICPPKAGFGLAVVAPVGSSVAYDISVVFAEIQMDAA